MSFLVKLGQSRSNYVNALFKCCIFALSMILIDNRSQRAANV